MIKKVAEAPWEWRSNLHTVGKGETDERWRESNNLDKNTGWQSGF